METIRKKNLGSRFFKYVVAAALALSVQTGWSADITPTAQAESAQDPAPYIQAKVVNENAGKRVLFDNTHAQTAGAADWVIDGGFSDFGNALASDGYYVKELRKSTPITLTDLSDYDVFVVAEPNIPFKQSEQMAMEQYVDQGGSIFFIGDHYNADRNKNRWDGSESINGYRRGAYTDPAKGMSTEEKNSAAMQGVVSSDWLADNFGVRFRYNALGDITANNIVAPSQSFGITEGVSKVAMHAGSTLAIIDPTKAKGIVYLPKTNAAWGNAVDQGVYNGGGIEEGPYVAVAKAGLGKAAFIGDSSPVEDATPKYVREENGSKKTTYDGFKEQDDGVLLVNLVNWLSEDEDYSDFTEVDGLALDQPTPLLPFEVPAASTEPQSEPWSQPAAGYKWWDSSTFKAGSYGSTAATPSSPQYNFVHQNQLPNSEVFQIRVVVNNLAPNSTVTGYSAGIYTTGGTQVAKIQNADLSWPSAYGYSQTFSLTANSKGIATKDITVQIKPGTTGAANLRLRLNGNNLVTNPVTIANVPAEPLPDGEGQAPEITLSTISEARTKSEGAQVMVEGVVTTQPGSFGGQAFYIQDDTAGIYVYQTQSGFKIGDKVRVKAALTVYNTELELDEIESIEKIGDGNVPSTKPVVSLGDDTQGQLVQLNNVTIENLVSASPAGSFEFDAVGEQKSHVRIDARTGITVDNFPYKAGDKVNLTGISAIFRGVYQLKPRGLSDITLAESTEPETPEEPSEPVLAEGVPGQAVLTSNNGHDNGLQDGSYEITMNLWWGNNATEYKLYENGTLIDTQKISDRTPERQSAVTSITGKANGTYTYKSELTNSYGTSASTSVVVVVTDANPGKAILSHDNWDQDGNYKVEMNLWWGTNATSYRLYENRELIDTQSLSAQTPNAQRAVSAITNRSQGTYEYYAELVNDSGKTVTDKVIVVVK
ncbi:chitinase N-terminal domain-containing protein [Paenibacillus polygoni]|uniref:Chitinase N-terminal domain-containing protein n=1 Tax=Paenibacillus polygoni TaxID=3050112 RepID=A0ABY8X8N0_9BACL|nr:chitinase N-terminal domain-containing protein [Paenibacillus polygoni]WIV21059.1 chitinase N-terminal domain-containing protein [Paenibacillus polygoni]